MTAWSKKKPVLSENCCAYGVVQEGARYGVALFRKGEPPARIRTVGMRKSEDKLQAVADRLNSRIGVPLDAAVTIIKEATNKWIRRSKAAGPPLKALKVETPFHRKQTRTSAGSNRSMQ